MWRTSISRCGPAIACALSASTSGNIVAWRASVCLFESSNQPIVDGTFACRVSALEDRQIMRRHRQHDHRDRRLIDRAGTIAVEFGGAPAAVFRLLEQKDIAHA